MNYFKKGGPSPGFVVVIGLLTVAVITCSKNTQASNALMPKVNSLDEARIAFSVSCKTTASQAGMTEQVAKHKAELDKYDQTYREFYLYYSARTLGYIIGVADMRQMPGLTLGQKVMHCAADLYEQHCAHQNVKDITHVSLDK